MPSADVGGRIFFSSTKRTMTEEDEIRLLSVGVDIGSATSHLVFSRLTLERLDNRYIVSAREVLYQSAILLTPYTAADNIDAESLGTFITAQYAKAGMNPDEIDTGALILTGVAVRRRNARSIGEIFAEQAGKLVAVSAGDNLETTMAAYGSGAVARSIRDRSVVVNVDIGGGTSKIAVCADGKVIDLTAIDLGARLVCWDGQGRVTRVEEAGRQLAAGLGIDLPLGGPVEQAALERLADHMADRLFDSIRGVPPAAAIDLYRLNPLTYRGPVDQISFSGGVSEYIYGRQPAGFGDLGPLLATAIRGRVASWGPILEEPAEGIRATVIGASQHTVQVSGSTLYVSPLDILPLRNLPVIAPNLALDDEDVDSAAIADALGLALERLDLGTGNTAVAVFIPWRGSATFQRLDAFCRGIFAGMAALLARGHPLVLIGDSDIGGLIGMHCREELRLTTPIVSIDGLDLKEFEYVDIGTMLDSSGAVPVVIKSLIFPSSEAIGRERAEMKPNGVGYIQKCSNGEKVTT
jgi:ethanolamine utilization protein EutA